ncbi:hypothetical protein PR048_025571 [Dryococelus australis]|uniref:Uncharacterized protein n=1 Tax=Dryococelus australis TaxID=614101 RepID=A0ABQ9GRM6_9NEOP|nr:hypothetical protein PR048_025571 [Dryococelus australis]
MIGCQLVMPLSWALPSQGQREYSRPGKPEEGSSEAPTVHLTRAVSRPSDVTGELEEDLVFFSREVSTLNMTVKLERSCRAPYWLLMDPYGIGIRGHFWPTGKTTNPHENNVTGSPCTTPHCAETGVRIIQNAHSGCTFHFTCLCSEEVDRDLNRLEYRCSY